MLHTNPKKYILNNINGEEDNHPLGIKKYFKKLLILII